MLATVVADDVGVDARRNMKRLHAACRGQGEMDLPGFTPVTDRGQGANGQAKIGLKLLATGDRHGT